MTLLPFYPLRNEFCALTRRYNELERAKAALIVDEHTYAQQLDLLRFQTTEISASNLQIDEETQLGQDFQRVSNAAKLLELSQSALNLLSEQESSLLVQTGELGRILQTLTRVDPKGADLSACHEQAAAALQELQSGLRHYFDSVELTRPAFNNSKSV